MLTRLIDFLKTRQLTLMLTSLTAGGSHAEQTEVGISSLIDTWLLVRDIEVNGERNRGLYVIKSRGMAHSNQVREFLLTSKGIQLLPVYLGTSGVLTGSARVAQEARERAETMLREQEIQRQQMELDRKREETEARITALKLEFDAERKQIERTIELSKLREQRLTEDKSEMAMSRRGNNSAGNSKAKANAARG